MACLKNGDVGALGSAPEGSCRVMIGSCRRKGVDSGVEQEEAFWPLRREGFFVQGTGGRSPDREGIYGEIYGKFILWELYLR